MPEAVAATVLFALSAIGGSRSALLLGGNMANIARLLLAGLFLGAYAHTLGSGVQGSAFAMFFISGVVGFGIGDAALFQAYPRLGARLTVLLAQCLAAPMAAFAEWMWMGTTMTLAQMAWGTVILAGVVVALAPDGRDTNPAPHIVTGAFFGIIAAAGQGLGAVISRKAFVIAAAHGEVMDGPTAAYQRMLGGVLFGAIIILMIHWLGRNSTAAGAGNDSNAFRRPWKKAFPWLLMNSLAGPAIGVSFYQLALKHYPSGVVLPIVAATPLVVIPFAYFIEKDKPRPMSLAGGLLAVAGAVALTLAS